MKLKIGVRLSTPVSKLLPSMRKTRGDSNMKYEEPILRIMEFENEDIVCASKTPGCEWGGDNDEDFV